VIGHEEEKIWDRTYSVFKNGFKNTAIGLHTVYDMRRLAV
jgi:hypothetical protein